MKHGHWTIVGLGHFGGWLSVAWGSILFLHNASAGECLVDPAFVPDVVHLREETAKRASFQAQARMTPVIVGEPRPVPVYQPPVTRPTRAQQRELDNAANNRMSVSGIAAGYASPALTKTQTVEVEGKRYSVTTVIGASPAMAAEAVRRGLERETRLGPERNPLILAAADGNLAVLRDLVRQGVTVRDVKDREGKPAALLATILSHWYGEEFDDQVRHAPEVIEVAKLLVDSGAPVDAAIGRGSALSIIVEGNQYDPDPPGAIELAGFLLQHGATLTAPVSDRVAERGDDALFEVLLREGKLTQDQKNTAMLVAVALGRLKVAQLAIEAGANPDVSPRQYGKCCDQPIIDEVLMRPSTSRDLLKTMVRHHFNPNVELRTGATPLSAVVHDHELMEDFIGLGANVDSASRREGRTPLHAATAFEWDPPRGYPLRYFSPAIRARSVEILIRHGANANATDQRGITPLMQTTADDAASIALLLDAGAHVNTAVRRDGMPLKPDVAVGPVTWALWAMNDTLASELVRRQPKLSDADCGAAFYAAAGGAAETLGLLLDRKADPHGAVDVRGRTALIAAAAAGHASTVSMLLERKVSRVDEETQIPSWLTARIMAEYARSAELQPRTAMAAAIVEGMLRKESPEGVTALMAAAANGHVDVVRLLLGRGASVRARDANGQTALDLAQGAGKPSAQEIVELLKANGATASPRRRY